MKQEIKACIAQISQRTETTFDFVLDVGNQAEEARPGQFVSIKCGDGLLLRRPVSIADADEKTLRIVFDIRGKGTRWLAAQHTGAELSILGPLGNGFHLNMPSEKRMLFIGGGIGAPPMHFAAKRCANPADVVLGFRSKDVVMMEEDMKNAADTVVICTDDGSYGKHAFATKEAEQLILENDYGSVFACGPRGMLREVALLAQRYALPCQLSLEERMGCSIGACLVCAVPIRTGEGIAYKHVCKDGPVFDAKEVCFDA